MPHLTRQRTPHTRAPDSGAGLSHAIAPAMGASALERALLAALSQRRAHLLHHLAEQVGPQAFAQVLGLLSPRQAADVLSLLDDGPRAAICAQLPPAVRRQWHAPADAPRAGRLARIPGWAWPRARRAAA